MQRWRRAWQAVRPAWPRKGRRPGAGWRMRSWRSWTGCWMRPGRVGVVGPAVDAGPDPGPGRREVRRAVHRSRDLVPAAPPRVELPAGRPPRRRARRWRDRGLEEGDLAADKRTAASFGGWIVFEDETGQSLRPPKSRTWGRRGVTPVIRVRGSNPGSVSVAGLACYRAGHRTRPIHRLHHYRGPAAAAARRPARAGLPSASATARAPL